MKRLRTKVYLVHPGVDALEMYQHRIDLILIGVEATSGFDLTDEELADPRLGFQRITEMILDADIVVYIDNTASWPGVEQEIDLARSLGKPVFSMSEFRAQPRVFVGS